MIGLKMSNNIVVKNITISFPNNVVYQNATLELVNNSITQFSAPSGAGKTVLVRYLIDNTELKISYSPQNSILLNHLFPSEFIKLVLQTNGQDFNESKVNQYLIKYEIPNKVIIRNLSNGQKSRLQVLLTVLVKADLYILDEPFASLDSENIIKMIELIKENSKTYLIINHQTEFLLEEIQLVKIGTKLRTRKGSKDE
jgi:ABC-type multidrug transport system ATPase subunit